MDFAYFMGSARVIENALCHRGLARVNVGHDPDIPDL
jgi:hypothetical protein